VIFTKALRNDLDMKRCVLQWLITGTGHGLISGLGILLPGAVTEVVHAPVCTRPG